jgi:predicted TPR repeat methyltransferase
MKKKLDEKLQITNTYHGTELMENIERSLPTYTEHLCQLVSKSLLSLPEDENSSKPIIDFGAGLGTISGLLRDRTTRQISCVEIDDNLASVLRTRNFSVFSDLSKAEATNFIFSINVMEHIKDDVGIIEEIYSHLNDGGLFAVYVPAFMQLFTNLDTSVGHYRRYSKKELVEKLEQSGFVVTDVRYVDCLGGISTLLLRLLGSRFQMWSLSPRRLAFFDKRVFPLSVLMDKLFSERFFGKNLFVLARK